VDPSGHFQIFETDTKAAQLFNLKMGLSHVHDTAWIRQAIFKFSNWHIFKLRFFINNYSPYAEYG